ncbi:hypothetical protein YC2023_006209 [Brassica napus]
MCRQKYKKEYPNNVDRNSNNTPIGALPVGVTFSLLGVSFVDICNRKERHFFFHYDLKQELLNGLLKFDFKLLSSDHNIVCSFIITLMADLRSFKSDSSLSLWS